jgi:hypothetical protein
MTTPITLDEHVNQILHRENSSLRENLETTQSCYDDLTQAIEEHLSEHIFDDDVAAVAIYCDTIKRVANLLPKWTFLKGERYPEEGQLVTVAYIDDTDGDAKSVEAKWEDKAWVTAYPCLELGENVYAWTFLLTPPRPLDE